MPIDIDIFENEGKNIVTCLEKGMTFGRTGQYDLLIESMTEVIISAGRLMQRDPEIGRVMRMDRTILVAEGYQLIAYAGKLCTEQENREQIVQEMGRIARGDVAFENPYFAEIIGAMGEWKETGVRGDFYTRLRT